MTFRDILAQFRNISFSKWDKGDRFKRLMQASLQTVPLHERQAPACLTLERVPLQE